MIYLIWNYSQPVLLAMAGDVRRQRYHHPDRRHRAAAHAAGPPRRSRSTRLASFRTPRTVALVGSESLMGREIRDVFATGKFPAQLKLIASDDEKPAS